MADAKRPRLAGSARAIAVVPARGGSVSVPLKNIKLLNGRPLLEWCVRSAIDSGCFAEVYVSTDHDGIAEAAEKAGAKVHRRAAETATNTASTESAMVDFANAHPDFDILCLIQATSPLLTPDHFKEGFEVFNKTGADSLVTAVRAHRFLWEVSPETGVAKPKNYNPQKRPRRQDWNGELVENGAYYLTTKAQWDASQCRLGGKMALYEMPEHTFVEIDSPTDWEILQELAKQHGYNPDAK